MTTTLNESMNETLKELQSTLIKTVEELIAKKRSVINLNMIQTIQYTLTRQIPKDTTQANHHSPNNISQSPLTKPSILATKTTNEVTNIEAKLLEKVLKRRRTLTPSEHRMINFAQRKIKIRQRKIEMTSSWKIKTPSLYSTKETRQDFHHLTEENQERKFY